MNEPLDITEVIKDLMKAKGIGANKLASLTDVPNRFIDALLQGDTDKLPAKPYIRGYLFKISSVLEIDNDELWQIYRLSADSKSSGDQDRLPINRYALKKGNSKHVVWGLIAVTIVVFIIFNYNRILGKPTLDVDIPETTTEELLTVEGLINPDDRLTLNEELIYTDDTGLFTKQVRLEPGLNPLKFKIRRYLGRETIIIKQVFYQPQTNASEEENREN